MNEQVAVDTEVLRVVAERTDALASDIRSMLQTLGDVIRSQGPAAMGEPSDPAAAAFAASYRDPAEGLLRAGDGFVTGLGKTALGVETMVSVFGGTEGVNTGLVPGVEPAGVHPLKG